MMKRPLFLVAVILASGVIISSAILFSISRNNSQNTVNTKEMQIDKVMKYKTAYIGDNSKVMNLIQNLPGGNFDDGIILETDKTPYGVEVNYGIKNAVNADEKSINAYWTDETTKKTFLNNATALFALVDNLDRITFKFNIGQGKEFTITRKEMEDFYGKDLRRYAENTALWNKEVLKDTLNSNEKLQSFFILHSITEQKTKVEIIN